MNMDSLANKAAKLRIYSVQSHWAEIAAHPEALEVISKLIDWEEQEKIKRRLALYLRKANTSEFEPISSFDWSWYKRVDRTQIIELFNMEFVTASENVIMIGPSGVGKTTIAKNLIFSAAQQGISSLFTESAALLDDLSAQKGIVGLEKALSRYTKPQLLAIDEIGYLSYNNLHADLLFQLIHKRHTQKRATIVTTNRPFEEWADVFPNAASVTALIDRLVERCEIVKLDAESYRGKRFNDNQRRKKAQRASKKLQASQGAHSEQEEA